MSGMTRNGTSMTERRVVRVSADIDLMKLLDWVNELLEILSPRLSTDVEVTQIGNVWIAKVYA